MIGATDHFKKKCPQKEAIAQAPVVARRENEATGADEDAYHEKLREEQKQRLTKLIETRMLATKKKPKIVKF